MLEFVDKLIAPEWRTAISPRNIGDSVLKCIRILCSTVAQTTRLVLGTKSTRNYYSVISVSSDAIRYDGARYLLSLATPYIDCFGAGLNKNIALIGRDYVYRDGVYSFKRHPSSFGTSTTVDGKPTYTFVCIGGSLTNTLNPLGLPYFSAVSDTTTNAMSEAISGTAPLGITQNLITAAFGCKFSENVVVDTWEEGDMRFGLTDNDELLYAPIALSQVTFNVGKKVDYSALLSPIHYFAAKLVNGTFVFSLGLNTLSAIPDLLQNYPELSPLNSTTFIGAELLSILRKKGCVFWEIPYIKQGIDQGALSNYAVNPGRVNINGVLELSGASTPLRQPPAPIGSYSCETTSMVVYNCM